MGMKEKPKYSRF